MYACFSFTILNYKVSECKYNRRKALFLQRKSACPWTGKVFVFRAILKAYFLSKMIDLQCKTR